MPGVPNLRYMYPWGYICLSQEVHLLYNRNKLPLRHEKSNDIWLRALMQSDCLYSPVFFEHYNRILLCE